MTACGDLKLPMSTGTSLPSFGSATSSGGKRFVRPAASHQRASTQPSLRFRSKGCAGEIDPKSDQRSAQENGVVGLIRPCWTFAIKANCAA